MKNIKIDEKILKVMGMAAGGLVIFILLIALISSCTKPKKYTIENIGELEAKLITLAKEYFEENEENYPKDGSSTNLSIDILVENNKIKPLDEIIEGAEYCSGQINVVNNNGFYLYIPKIDCGDFYKAKSLTDELTADKNIVTTGNGLYKNADKYIYRGETLNNYLLFADKTWVILEINVDGTLKVMETTKREAIAWDDRYNSEKSHNLGINDYVSNNINSRIKDKLLEIYNDETDFSDTDKAHFIKQNLCIGKRAEADNINDGSIECSEKLENEIFGLITVSEYIQASLDENCTTTLNDSCVNYNFLANLSPSYWTMTADKNTSYKVYKISDNMNLVNATNPSSVKIVAILTNELLYSSGDGSLENPYQLVTSPITKK